MKKLIGAPSYIECSSKTQQVCILSSSLRDKCITCLQILLLMEICVIVMAECEGCL